MLEKIPVAVGEALAGIRAGLNDTLFEQLGDVPASLAVTSPAFGEGDLLDRRFTGDGAGSSPPLAWHGAPAEAKELLLLVEDADSPTPHPIVHAIVHRLPPGDGQLAEGALDGDGSPGVAPGLNSSLKPGWLPPDPPNGHGDHRYCFQLFALGAPAGLADHPGRGAVAKAVLAHAIARGRLIGLYRRG